MPIATKQLEENIAAVKERIARAAQQAGRNPAEITLVAVSKTHPPETVEAAARAGLADFGENRLEEAGPKMKAVAADGLRWHMIGHLQSRKAGEAGTAGFALIHSVDSLKLAQRLSRQTAAAGLVVPVLLECNVSGEVSKEGFAAEASAQWQALLPEVSAILALPGLEVRGLMTMAPVVQQPAATRPFFRRLRELRDCLRINLPQNQWRELSMGMTDDFESAIAEGATLVRIGRAIFGERR
jgi:pyridoxal phosphate enzyme (YggS family)